MNARMLRALDAVAADDEVRARTLASLAAADPAGPVPPIPPLARVGLVAIGLHLARAHVERAAAGRPDAAELTRELELLDAAVRAAYSATATR